MSGTQQPYIDPSETALFAGQQFTTPYNVVFSYAPFSSGTPWPVSLGTISPGNFFAATYVVPVGGDATHVGIGTINGLVTTGGSISGTGHSVGEMGWNIGNIGAGQTQVLIVGQESKLSLIGSGTYTLAYSNLSNIDLVASTVTLNGVLANYNAQNAGLSTSVPVYASYTTSFSFLAAGKTVTVWKIFDMEPPSNIAGTIQNVWGLYMPAWTGINIPGQFYAINILDSRAAINTLGQIIGAAGQEIGPSESIGYPARQYQFGVGWNAALTTLALGGSLAYYAIFVNPYRQTFSKVGLEVTTPQASSSIQWAVFNCANGAPVGAPLYVSQNHAATAAGVIEEASANLTLQAGTYMIAVLSNVTGVAVRAVTDNGAAKAVGAHTSNTSLDTMPYSAIVLNANPALTFPATPPAIAGYSALGSVYPQVWFSV